MTTIPRTSGVYKITCVPTGKIYIGSASNMYTRILGHKTGLRHGTHSNGYLQAAWNKYGEQSFQFDVIEFVLVSFIFEREQYYIDKLKTNLRDNGFNIQAATVSTYGVVSGVTNRKTRPPLTEEHKAKIGAANRGRKWTEDRQKRNHQKKRSASGFKRRSPSPETREKLSQALKAYHKAQDALRGD